jgi:hypothetical protein
MSSTATSKHFDVWMAERSYRYKEEALYSHAPQKPGIYQLVTFDEQQNGIVLYIGLTLDKTIFDALYEHWRGQREPKVQDLLSKYPNLYFGYVVDGNIESVEDLKDLYWAMVQTDKPALMDPASIQHSGRYGQITYKDKSIL